MQWPSRIRLPGPLRRPVEVGGKGLMLLAVGAAYLLNRALAPKPPKAPVDTTSPTLSERGSYVPYVLGRRRVGPVVGWVGSRRREKRSAGGGKGGGGGKAKYNVYYEQGWHQLCLGPLHYLHGIYVSGQREAGGWARELGSSVFLSYGEHGFHIYFGECDQPVNTLLGASDRVGVSSAWPAVAYVHWKERSLGQSATWPQIEYDCEVRPGSSPITGGAAWLDASTASISTGTDEEGVNPAHALYYLLTAPPPFGRGISPTLLDLDFFNDLAELAEDEHLPVNILAAQGQDVATTLANLLGDCGIVIPQVGKLLAPKALREDTGTIPEIAKALYQYEAPDLVIANERTAVTRTIYSFANVARGFAAQDVPIGDDSQEYQRGQRRERTQPLQTITHWNTAVRVIDRREQEALAGSQLLTVTAYRNAKMLSSGQVVEFEGLGQMRVLTVARDRDSGDWRIECMPDIYALGTAQGAPGEPEYPDDPEAEVAEADRFFYIETPRALGDGTSFGLFVLRIPANNFVAGALQHVSDTDSSYQAVGEGSGNGFGGTLCEDVPEDDTTITTGPVFYVEGGDAGSIDDLTGSTSRWQSGEQVLVSEHGEIMYVQALTAIGSNFYRADGLIRARLGTVPQRHPWGTRVVLAKIADLVQNAATFLAVGLNIYLKSQPYTNEETFDLAQVTPFVREWQGHSKAPLPVTGVSANSASNEYTTSGDIVVDFTTVNEDQDGNTIALDAIIVEVLDFDGTVLRTITESSPAVGADAITYSNANLVADFGGEPERVDLRVLAISGDNRSAATTIRVHLDTAPQGADGIAVMRAETFGPASVIDAEPGILETYQTTTQELL